MSIRTLAVTALVMTIVTPAARAQGTPSSSPPDSALAVPNLAGRWQVSSPLGHTFYMSIEQHGEELRASAVQMLMCGQGQVTLTTKLGGIVRDHDVQLRTTESGTDRIGTLCYEPDQMADVHFVGKLSEDGKMIRGPYGNPPRVMYVWTLKRVK